MGRIATTISLARSSWAVLKADRELVLLPVMSGIASLVVMATFVVPVVVTSDDLEATSQSPTAYVLLFLMYVVLAYITVFFNAALIHAANERLDGGDPTLGSAINGALARAGRILPWAIISATVSLILRSLEERAGFIGRIVIGFVGIAWSLVTFLVLPVLVLRDVGVGDAFRESTDLFKRTWGENVAAQVGFGLLGFVAILVMVPIVALVGSLGGGLAAFAVVIAVTWVIVVAVVLSALSGIFQTALYRFATTGTAGGGFDDGALGTAFAPR